MSRGNQQLGFAIRAVNESNAALQDARGDLEKLEQTARGVDYAVYDLNAAYGTLSKTVKETDLGDVADVFGDLERTLGGVEDIMDVLEDQFGVGLGPLQDWTSAAGELAGGFESVISGGMSLAKSFPPMLATMGPLVASTWAYVAALYAQAVAFVVANAPLLLIIAGLALLAAGVVLAIKHWDEITKLFNEHVTPALKAIWEKGLEPVWNFVRDHWKTIGVLISGPFAPIVLLATDAFGIRSKLIAAFQAVIDFIGGLPGDAKRVATSLGEALKDGIVAGLSTIVSAADAIGDSIIAALKSAWNTAIQWADDNLKLHIPGVSVAGQTLIPDVNWDPDLSFLKLAQGGIVTRPTLALIGEAGPEAVVPLSGGGARGFGEVHIHVQALDARSFADWLERGGGREIARYFDRRQVG